MTGRRFRPSRRQLAGVLVGCLAVIAASTSNSSAATQVASIPLKGEGSWGAYQEILTWQNDMSSAASPSDLSYAAHGSLLGRQDFLAGNLDFVLSGVPFTPAELTKVKGGAAGLIDAPVQVSSMAFMLQRPVPDGLTEIKVLCDPDDPNVPDPTKCVVKKPYTGPVRVPNSNLAAMLLKYAGTGATPLSSWNNPSVLKAMNVSEFTTPPLAGPAPVLRSDQDEFNYYLQQFASTTAPGVWSGLKQQDTRIAWDPITERLPRQAGASRDGVDQQSQQLALGGGDPSSGTISGFTAGVFAPVPASTIAVVRKTFPDAHVEYMEAQNANGDWVAPTPESITKAVAAGGNTPLFALTNKVSGAYPLAWVDHLYAPAHGLSQQKTEALAAVIRYLATAGQRAAEPVGEGQLPDALVKQALAAADQLVRSNCTGKVIENTDPGPYAPNLPAMKSIGMMAHCTTDPVDTTSASTSGSGDTGSFDGSGFSSTGSTTAGTTGGLASTDAGAGASGTAVIAKDSASVALAATKLPLPLPSATSGFDRLATLLLGVGLFFVLRRPVRTMLERGRQ